jgi:hypothetical protein
MRVIEYYGETLEISDFEDCHRYANQSNWTDGIAVNPTLRPDFDDTPNELREDDEINDWWGKPYIVTTHIDELPLMSQTWDEKVALFRQHNWALNETREQFEATQAEARARFLADRPEGINYTVRCLDGGAHDRSTWCGEFATLAEAVAGAKARANQQGRFRF